MRLQKLTVTTFSLFLMFGLFISNNELTGRIVIGTKAQTTEEKNLIKPQPMLGASVGRQEELSRKPALVDKFKSAIKDKEVSWELVNKEDTGSYGYIILNWKSQKKWVRAYIHEYKSVEEAAKTFSFSMSPFSNSLGLPTIPQKGFGDEAYFKITAKNEPRNLNFRKGQFVISLEGQEADVVRFAKHFLYVIESQ